MKNIPYYVKILKDELLKRKSKSSAYSMRAFARDLDINQATLSRVISGNRSLPLHYTKSVANKIVMSPQERTLFFESIYKRHTSLDSIKIPAEYEDERFMVDDSYISIVSEWEYYGVLTLFDIPEFLGTASDIKRFFDISDDRISYVTNKLLEGGFLKKTENGFERTYQGSPRTTEDIQSVALQKAHLETLEIAKEKLFNIDVDLRDYSHVTIAIGRDKIPEVKTIIREFRQKLMALAKTGQKDEIYRMAIQLFPLSNVSLNHEKVSVHN